MAAAWIRPEAIEIKMDAEIGSYQLDDEPHETFADDEERDDEGAARATTR